MLQSVLVSLDGRTRLTEEVMESIKGQPINISLGEIRRQKFSDKEVCPDFSVSVRGKRVYILTSPSNAEEILELFFAIDAARRAAAKEIIPIIPYYPYQRSDKKDQARGPICAKVIARILERSDIAGIVTFDLHADQIQGFFDIPVTHLEGKNVFDNYIASIYDENTILCGPDAGSGKRVKRMKEQLKKYHDINLNYVMMDKTRSEANVVDEMYVIGDVKGKNVIILDDMVDTAGTLCKAAEVLIEEGANSVRAIISHGVLSGPAYERISNSMLTELVISDSLDSKECNKISVISLSEQIGLAITAIDSDSSYEGLKGKRF